MSQLEQRMENARQGYEGRIDKLRAEKEETVRRVREEGEQKLEKMMDQVRKISTHPSLYLIHVD